MRANIQKWGNSQAVRLPKALLEISQLSENDAVEIIAEKNAIIIRKAENRTHKTLKERLKNFDAEYQFSEFDTGEAVGREVL